MDAKIRTKIADTSNVASKLKLHLDQLFGFKSEIDFNLGSLVPPLSAKEPIFNMKDLFASFCFSREIVIPESIYTYLENQKPNHLNIASMKFSPKYTFAIKNSLKFATSLTSIAISANNIPDIFKELAMLITQNQNIQYLSIYSCDTLNNFSDFLSALFDSSITSITFVNVSFGIEQLAAFSDSIDSTPITELSFIHCPFNLALMNAMKERCTKFESILSFKMSKTNILAQDDIFSSLVSFILGGNISSVNLSESGADVTKIFEALDKTELPITSINASGCVCSENFTGNYQLPVTLRKVTLTKVTWKGISLTLLLTKQPFVTHIELDVSSQLGQAVDGSSDVFKTLPKRPFQSLIWDNNTVSPGFFNFLLHSTSLEKLSLNSIVIPKTTAPLVNNAMILYVQSSPLKSLSLRGGKSATYPELVVDLVSVLSTNNTIERLDISHQSVGDKGLECVVQYALASRNVRELCFDGAKPTPSGFIRTCNAVASIESLENVAWPREDCEFIIGSLGRRPPSEEVSAALQAVMRAFPDGGGAGREAPRPVARDVEAGPGPAGTRQVASWAVQAALESEVGVDVWSDLRAKYSVEKLTGRRPAPEPAVDNLIEF